MTIPRHLVILLFLAVALSSCCSYTIQENPPGLCKILSNARNKGTQPYLDTFVDKFVPCENGQIPVYTFQIKNIKFEPNTQLGVYTRNCAGEIKKMSDAYVNYKGEVILKGSNNSFPFETFRYAIGSYSPGECTDFILASSDFEIGASAHFVLHPLEAKSETGQLLTLETRYPYGQYYEAFAKGYSPHEQLITTSQSEHEVMKSTCNADENGEVHHMIMPYVKGIKNGYGSFTLTRLNGDSLTVKYPWGSENTKPYLLKNND